MGQQNKHTNTHTGKKPSAELVAISTKTFLQMNSIDLYSLFSGAERNWSLFEWKSAPFNRLGRPAFLPRPAWMLLACYSYWYLKRILWSLLHLETLHCLKLCICCMLVSQGYAEDLKGRRKLCLTLSRKLQLNKRGHYVHYWVLAKVQLLGFNCVKQGYLQE